MSMLVKNPFCANIQLRLSNLSNWSWSHVKPFLSPLQVESGARQWCWGKRAQLERSSPGHHLGLAPGMTGSSFSPSHVGSAGCWVVPYLSHNLMSAQWGWSQSFSLPIVISCCCFLTRLLFDRRRGSLLSALELGLNPGSSRIIGRRKNLRPASNPKILEKSLADSQAHQKLCQNWCGVIVVSHLLKIIPCPCNQCSSNKWRVEDAH